MCYLDNISYYYRKQIRISWKLENSTTNQQNIKSKFQKIVLNVNISSRTTTIMIWTEKEEMRVMYLFLKSRSAFSTILYGKIFPKSKKSAHKKSDCGMKQNKNVNGCRADNIHIVISCFLLVTHTSLFHGKMNIQSPDELRKLIYVLNNSTMYLQMLRKNLFLNCSWAWLKSEYDAHQELIQ